MAKGRMDLAAYVGKLLEDDDVDVLREGVRVLAQAIMDAEVSAQIGAGLHERSFERTAHRRIVTSRLAKLTDNGLGDLFPLDRYPPPCPPAVPRPRTDPSSLLDRHLRVPALEGG